MSSWWWQVNKGLSRNHIRLGEFEKQLGTNVWRKGVTGTIAMMNSNSNIFRPCCVHFPSWTTGWWEKTPFDISVKLEHFPRVNINFITPEKTHSPGDIRGRFGKMIFLFHVWQMFVPWRQKTTSLPNCSNQPCLLARATSFLLTQQKNLLENILTSNLASWKIHHL